MKGGEPSALGSADLASADYADRGHAKASTIAARPAPPIPIFVINLARDVARMQTMDHALRELGLEYERVEAFDGRANLPRVRQWLRREFFSRRLNRPLTVGELGCTLSHVRVLRAVTRRQLAAAIIFEDDVEFGPGFAAFVRNELPVLLRRCDVIKLEGIRDRRSSRAGVRLARSSFGDVFVPLRPSLGSAAYAVNRAGARRLLHCYKRLDRPIDHLLAAYDQHGAIFAEFTQFPSRQIAGDSNIAAERKRALPAPRSFFGQITSRIRVACTGIIRIARISAVFVRRGLGAK